MRSHVVISGHYLWQNLAGAHHFELSEIRRFQLAELLGFDHCSVWNLLCCTRN